MLARRTWTWLIAALVAALLAAVLFALLSPGAAAAQRVEDARLPDEADIQTGSAIATRWCTSCHAVGSGHQGADLAPTFGNIATRRSADYLRGFLANPHVTAMSELNLSLPEINALVAYIKSLEG